MTTPAVIEHTETELFAIAIVGARKASLSTETVYVLPTTGDEGEDDRNIKFCTIFETVIVSVAESDK